MNLGSSECISRAVKSQSALLRVFSLPNLSLRIAAYLLKQALPSRNTHSDGQQSNTANTSSDYSIVSFDKRSNEIKLPCSFGPATQTLCLRFHLARADVVHQHFSAKIYLYLLLLMLMCLFARSSLETAALITLISSVTTAQLRRISWVFSLFGEREGKI
jgi:hypothetical protein